MTSKESRRIEALQLVHAAIEDIAKCYPEYCEDLAIIDRAIMFARGIFSLPLCPVCNIVLPADGSCCDGCDWVRVGR